MTDRRLNMINDLKRIESLAYWLEGYVVRGGEEPRARVREIRGLSRRLMEVIEEMPEEPYE